MAPGGILAVNLGPGALGAFKPGPFKAGASRYFRKPVDSQGTAATMIRPMPMEHR